MSSIPLPALHIQSPEDPMAQIGKAMQLKSLMQGQQMQNIQLQQAQQQQKDQQTVRKAFQDSNGDIDKTIAAAAKAGVSPQTLTALQAHNLDVKTKLATLNKDQLDNLSKQNDNAAGLIQPILDAPAEKRPALYAQARQQLIQNPQAYGITDPSQIPPEQYPGDDAMRSQLAIHQGGKQQFDNAMKKREVAAQELGAANRGGPDMAVFNALRNGQGQPNPGIPAPGQVPQGQPQAVPPVNPPVTGEPTQPQPAANGYAAAEAAFNARRDARLNGAQPQANVPVASLSPTEAFQKLQEMKQDAKPDKTASVDQQEMNAWLKKNPGKDAADYGAYKAKLVPAFNFNLQNSTANNMTDAALDNAAQKYWSQGVLPAGGRGPAVMAQNQKIMNRAAELHSGESITEGSAAFAANKHSLNNLQKNFDQVTAFENTAGKNLDVFLNTAKKVVDVGSPWINKPLRSIDAGGLGAEDQAAFNAARTTALTEIAKVLNSSNASGVLSDSARHEVEGLIGPGATLKQIVSAANVLKTDMANRHQSYQEQIDDIKGRLGGKPAQATPTPQTGSSGSQLPTQAAAQLQEGHETTFANGQIWTKKNGQPVQIK